jgi:flagellar protein FlaJ
MAKFFKWLAHQMPALEFKLRQARMAVRPEQFLVRTAVSAAYMAAGLLLVISAFFYKQDIFIPLMAVSALVLYPMMFFYYLRLPDVKSGQIMREINREVIDAGRFLIVELESGIPLFDAIKSASRNFPSIGKYFAEMVEHIETGTPIDDALGEVIEDTPSQDFRRILWQILNSLKTGAEVGTALREVIEQIGREQLVAMREYGRKLNPIAMFYLIMALIVPSLGVTLLVVFASFLAVPIDLPVFAALVLVLSLVQYMFVSAVKSTRPAVNT